MLVIIGLIIVLGCVLGGFMMHGGPIPVLLQWNEFLIIGGAALGSLIIGSPPSMLKQLLGQIISLLKGDKYTKQEYINLLLTMYTLSTVARRDGLIGLESHTDDPEQSEIFSKNPFLLANHHALNFFCDTLRLLVTGGLPAHEMETLLDSDLETHHSSGAALSGQLQKLGDSLPGLGIVAAVLGIVITMQAIDGPPSEIGEKVAAALVGTFLGILLSYGVIQPLATLLEHMHHSQASYFECIKTGVLAISKGYNPQIAAEFARRVIPAEVRPGFAEMEEAIKSSRKE